MTFGLGPVSSPVAASALASSDPAMEVRLREPSVQEKELQLRER